ncbi:hypothetical protein ACUXAV_005859 [Cupriavidus metallidurans]|jgi:hypothetical protein
MEVKVLIRHFIAISKAPNVDFVEISTTLK